MVYEWNSQLDKASLCHIATVHGSGIVTDVSK